MLTPAGSGFGEGAEEIGQTDCISNYILPQFETLKVILPVAIWAPAQGPTSGSLQAWRLMVVLRFSREANEQGLAGGRALCRHFGMRSRAKSVCLCLGPLAMLVVGDIVMVLRDGNSADATTKGSYVFLARCTQQPSPRAQIQTRLRNTFLQR